jgi:electron transfer flavoprotein beta subunit
VAAGVAALLGVPYLSYAAKIEPDPAARTVRVRRLSAKGYDLLEAPMPALVSCTQALGAPRYPSLKGIMAARQKEIVTKSLKDVGVETPVGGWSTKVLDATPPPARGETRVIRGPAAEAAKEVADFLAGRRII